jgi:hypothetical protein
MKNEIITIFVPRLHNNLRPMIEGFIKLGLTVSVLTLRKGVIEDYSKINYTILEKFSIRKNKELNPINIKKFFIPSPLQILKYFKLEKPKYLLVRNDHSFAYLPIFVIGKIFKCKIVLYNQYPIKNAKFIERVYNFFFYSFFKCKTISPVWQKKYANSETINNETHEQYEKRLLEMLNLKGPNHTPIWVPFGADEVFNQPKYLASNTINFLSIGKFQARKKHEVALELLKEYSERNLLKINFVIIGEVVPDNNSYFNALVRHAKYIQTQYFHVEILKNISRSEVRSYLIHSHYFILLSENEVASFSQLEAFLFNCKLIIFYENGFLDFLPKYTDYQVIRSLDEQLDYISAIDQKYSPVHNFFIDIYFKHCNSLQIAKRVVSIFESS